MRRIFIPWLAALAFSLALEGRAAAQEGPEPGYENAASAEPRGDRGKIKKVMKILKTEPSIRQVQKTAVRHYELEPERVNAMARNARLKGLIPDLTLGLENSVSNSFSNTKDGLYPILPSPSENPNPENLKERIATGDDRLGWSVNARWSLDRLVYSAESLDAKSLTSLQENLVREVTTLFYSRRRVLASLLMSPPTDDEEYFYELMRLEELTATLDAFTGGMFTEKAWRWEDELLK